MSKVTRNILVMALTMMAAICLVGATKLPLWSLRMEAPQYRDEEALRVTVFAGSMKGDLREITVLNQYIGVHIPAMLPQSKWLPAALLAAAALGMFASVLPIRARRPGMAIVSIALAATVGFAVFQARQQMHDIGHKRDAHTKLARVHDFDPPFLGTAKIAQFTVTSKLRNGAYLIGAAVALQFAGAIISRRQVNTKFDSNIKIRRVSPETAEVLV
jgi:copper chaperone NosL